MEPDKDVKLDSSPDMEEVLNDVPAVEGAPAVDGTPAPPAPAQEEAEVETSPQDVKEEVAPPDNRPIDNVAWEAKRKVDELSPKIDQILEQMSKGSQKKEEPQYSKAQLQAYAIAPETATEQRLWAYGEINKMDKTERMNEYQEIMQNTQTKSMSDVKRNQANEWVAKAFPDTVLKDDAGNPVDWDKSNPVLKRADEYMSQNRALQSDPEGLKAAVKMAAFDLGVQMNRKTQIKLDRTTGQLRKEQKKQLASSGGSRPTENAEQLAQTRYGALQGAYKKASKLRDKDTARKIFAEMSKIKGLNPFV